MDWNDLAKQVIGLGAPLLGTALGGPLGGAAGQILATVLGTSASTPGAGLDSLIPLLRKGREENPATAELSPTLEEATVGGAVWLLHQQLLQHGPDGVRAALPELMDIVLGPYIGVEEASRMVETMATGD